MYLLDKNVCVYSSKLLHELRQEAACCLGLLCAALSYEAEKIFRWMFVKFSSCSKDEVKLLYLVAVYKALETAGEKKAFSPVMQVPCGAGTRPIAQSKKINLITMSNNSFVCLCWFKKIYIYIYLSKRVFVPGLDKKKSAMEVSLV